MPNFVRQFLQQMLDSRDDTAATPLLDVVDAEAGTEPKERASLFALQLQAPEKISCVIESVVAVDPVRPHHLISSTGEPVFQDKSLYGRQALLNDVRLRGCLPMTREEASAKVIEEIPTSETDLALVKRYLQNNGWTLEEFKKEKGVELAVDDPKKVGRNRTVWLLVSFAFSQYLIVAPVGAMWNFLRERTTVPISSIGAPYSYQGVAGTLQVNYRAVCLPSPTIFSCKVSSWLLSQVDVPSKFSELPQTLLERNLGHLTEFVFRYPRQTVLFSLALFGLAAMQLIFSWMHLRIFMELPQSRLSSCSRYIRHGLNVLLVLVSLAWVNLLFFAGDCSSTCSTAHADESVNSDFTESDFKNVYYALFTSANMTVGEGVVYPQTSDSFIKNLVEGENLIELFITMNVVLFVAVIGFLLAPCILRAQNKAPSFLRRELELAKSTPEERESAKRAFEELVETNLSQDVPNSTSSSPSPR